LPTQLRHDFNYLKRLLIRAILLHRLSNIEQMTMLADIRDYFMFLTLDGLKDPQLAEQLVNRFCALQASLETTEITQTLQHQHTETIQFYVGFLFTMEELLRLRYGITMLPNEMISREDFRRSWIRTTKKLNLCDKTEDG